MAGAPTSDFRSGPLPTAATGVAAVDTVYAQDHRVFAVIARRKNGNVMVYRADAAAAGGAPTGAHSFWLDLEPSYRAAARARGRTHDREEWSVWDKLAYGYAVTAQAGSVTVRLAQAPGHALTVRWTPGPNRYYAYLQLQGQLCRLHHIYVYDRPGFPLPTVDYVHLVGQNRQRQWVTERIP